LRRAVGVRGGCDKASPGLGQAPSGRGGDGMERNGRSSARPGAPFLGDGRGHVSREEGDGSDKLGETVNFWGKWRGGEIF